MRSFNKFLTLTMAIVALSFVSISAQSLSGSAKTSGKTVEQQIFRKLYYLPRYGVFDHLTFDLADGTVTLNGKVNSMGTIYDAENEVKRIPGVTKVINNIEQLPASPYDNEIRMHALRAFTQGGPSQYFSEIRPDVRIIVENGRLTLEGYVANSGAYNMLNVLANGVPGVFSVQNNLIIGKDTSR